MSTTTESSTPVAIITGSAQRIGKALAIALHDCGYNVVLHYFRTSALPLAQQLNAIRKQSATAIQADLNSSDAPDLILAAVLNVYGRADVLINNASSFYPTRLGDFTERAWQDLFNTNAKAPLFLSQALAPYLKRQTGCILNIADIYATTPKREHTIYCMAKAANVMMTKSLAIELAPEIRVNGIAPGAALWPAVKTLTNQAKSLSEIPLGRLGGTDAIVETALFLITKGRYITGQIIAVDGGKLIAGIA
jgi:pteridine reductase